MMLKQSPKDPVWLVRYRTGIKRESSIVDARGKTITSEEWIEDGITAHAPDEAEAKAYVAQQNPDVDVVSAERYEP